jgi:anthranilate synthase component II
MVSEGRMILILDNYDSFTYNLVQYLGGFDHRLLVVRNDRTSADELLALGPERIVISPGPGRPEEAGVTVELIRRITFYLPLLGVCLGHQAIALAFGGRVERAVRPVHGKTSRVAHDGRGVLAGLAPSFQACRYHSLIVSDEAFPAPLEVAARSEDGGAIMALRHIELPIHGVQFHPESILTEEGRQILRNFVDIPHGVHHVRSAAREAWPAPRSHAG